MKFSLTIPDETFETYVTKFGLPGCYAQMRSAVEAFKNFDKNDRYVVIHGDVRRDIEAIFQTTVDSQDKLAKLIKNLNSVRIQDVDIRFSAEDLSRIEEQASFHGKDKETFIKEMVEEIVATMMERA